MKIRRHFFPLVNSEVQVEDGRLTIAVRQILTELGIEVSDVQSVDDILVAASRDPDGSIALTSESMTRLPTDARDQLLRLCRSIVGGTNLSGAVFLRFRIGSRGPVFISISTVK